MLTRLSIAAGLLLAPAGILSAGSPVTIGDGSICMQDPAKAFPGTAVFQYERPIQFGGALIGTANGSNCDTQPPADCPNCAKFDDSIRRIDIEYAEGQKKQRVSLMITGNNTLLMQVTGHSFAEWEPANQASKRKRNPNGTITKVAVDGKAVACANPCRVVVLDNTP